MTSVSRVCTSAWPGVSRRLAWILYASTSSSGFPLANAAATVLLSKNVMFAAGAIVLWARALPSGRAKPLTNKSRYTDRMTFAPFRSAVAGCGGEGSGAHQGDRFVARRARGAAHANRAARPAATVSITAASVNVFHVDMVVLLPFASVLCHLAEHLDHALAVLEVVEQLPVVLEPLHRVRQQPIEPSRILEGRLRQILHTRLEILAVRVHRPHHDLVAEHE